MRLFFALGCPADLAARITAWRSNLTIDGAPVPAANLHLTLAFLGHQDSARLPPLLQLASAIAAPTFTLELDRLDIWNAGLLCLAPSQPPPALFDLARRLRNDLLALGIASEPCDYLPHLTLARHCHNLLTVSPPTFVWQAGEFSLFVSEPGATGVSYRPLASWPLRRPA